MTAVTDSFQEIKTHPNEIPLKVLVLNLMRHLCPCCDRKLLRHLNHQEMYWFCCYCKQSMPVIKRQRKRLHEIKS